MKTTTFLCLALCILLAASLRAQAPAGGVTADAQIRQVLRRQVEAWNRGDLPGFMAGYWHSPELTFFTADGVKRGWEPVLERYRERYGSTQEQMGQLRFEDLKVMIFSADSAAATGRCVLEMKDSKHYECLFTLLLRKFPGEGWRIVHDHSSALNLAH